MKKTSRTRLMAILSSAAILTVALAATPFLATAATTEKDVSAAMGIGWGNMEVDNVSALTGLQQNQTDTAITTAEKHGGEKSLTFQFTDWQFIVDFDAAQMAGKKYELSLWLKGADLQGCIGLEVRDQDDATVNAATEAYRIKPAVDAECKVVPTEWTEYTFDLDMTRLTATKLSLKLLAFGGSGTLYIDDIRMIEFVEAEEESSDTSSSTVPEDEKDILKRQGIHGDMEVAEIADIGGSIYTDAAGSTVLTTEEKHGGEKSLKIDASADGWWGALFNVEELLPGKTYKVSLWLKASGVTGYIGIYVRDGAIDLTGSNYQAENSDWKEYVFEVTMPEDLDYFTIGVQPFSAGINGILYLDDVSVTEVTDEDNSSSQGGSTSSQGGGTPATGSVLPVAAAGVAGMAMVTAMVLAVTGRKKEN